jgi:hypothetical protein
MDAKRSHREPAYRRASTEAVSGNAAKMTRVVEAIALLRGPEKHAAFDIAKKRSAEDNATAVIHACRQVERE